MFHSVRARLTLWYTALLAVVLITFSGICYGLLARAIRSATDASIASTAREFASAFSTGRDVEVRSIYGERAILLFSPDGRLLATSHAAFATAEQQNIANFARSGQRSFATVEGGDEGDGIRVFRTVLKDKRILVVAQDLDPQADRLEDAATAVLLGIPIALLIAAFGGYLLAQKSLAPVAAMSDEARQIGAANLGKRIAVVNERDELGHLAATFNDLLGRLQRAFDSQRQFMADASHELRTPIAIILGEADVTLSRPERSRNEYRESLRIMQKAALKLTRIVQNVFLLARTDAGTYPMQTSRFYLDDVFADAVQAMRTVAAAKRIDVRSQLESDLVVVADEALMQQLIQNLIDNAVKFTPEGGRVTLTAHREGTDYVIRVADTGHGIAAADQPFIFDRFSRGADRSGAGLGLAIARWIADAHGAMLSLEKSDESGSVFRLVIPSSGPAAIMPARIAKGES